MKLIFFLIALFALPVFAEKPSVTPPDSPEAELALGKAYYYGQSRPADVGLAYFWFLIAESHGADTSPFMEMALQGVETGGLSADYIQQQVARYRVTPQMPEPADVRIPDAGSTYQPKPPPGLPPLALADTPQEETFVEKKGKSAQRNSKRNSVQQECEKYNGKDYRSHITFLSRRYQDIINRARLREMNGKGSLTYEGMQEIQEINQQIKHYEILERRAAEDLLICRAIERRASE